MTNSVVILYLTKKDNTMKILKTLLTFGLLFTATISNANDYALLNNYPLLNDMKMAKKEQALLSNMRQLIADRKNNNKNELKKQKKLFTAIIMGLSEGDSKLGLHGTELVFLKNKIKTIQLLWSQEKSILNSAMNNKMYKNDAYTTISRISTHMNDLNKLYKQSYEKYKQNSVMKSLVSSYMRGSIQTEQMYAMNIIK
ncbi:MAG: Nitric oxide-responding transcriptional regulator Dnr (Crp/Fnr family) [uncultured Sulfurovum sp.]|uniref:Nitric oxide-responding transcriptional regulator Dnr (Crp/Fnr family) n=1 Tax=uncultured Sulfurovum sp. TaxID=269237 RepID=A0A6S6TMY2_9BACT|nr:MAG: Nitric oxide-responding transcriptional regulator Dnr (Crp/Fnr family) [uncultured Sulfurovum sp.]